MIQLKERKKTFPVQQVSTPVQIIDTLMGVVKQREWALATYPNYLPNQQKLQLLGLIKAELTEAKYDVNIRRRYFRVLRLEVPLRQIAPRYTSKLYDSYMAKIELQMNYCRLFLQLAKQ